MNKSLLLVLILIILVGGAIIALNNKSSSLIMTWGKKTTTKEPEEATETQSVKEFQMIAKKFEFDPATIRVKQGDKIRLKIKSIDVNHGMAIPGLGIDVKLKPNIEETVEFTADKTGEFEFSCSVFCGEGHRGMKGKIIVE